MKSNVSSTGHWFLSDEGSTLETLDCTIRIGSTPSFLYFDLYLYSAYAARNVYFMSVLVSARSVKVRLHTAINRADFVSWCMLYTRTKVRRCIREKMTMCFRGQTIKSHSPGYEIGPINRIV